MTHQLTAEAVPDGPWGRRDETFACDCPIDHDHDDVEMLAAGFAPGQFDPPMPEPEEEDEW